MNLNLINGLKIFHIGIVFTWVFALQISTTQSSLAQSLFEHWSEPVAIYTTQEFVSGLRVLVDANEQFHLFWVENPTETSTASLSGAIFHMHGNGNQWSTANDVLVALNSRSIPSYNFFLDRENGLLHLLYIDSLPYYVNVPLHQAHNVSAWSMPESVIDRPVLSAGIYQHETRRYFFYVPIQPPFELYLLYTDMEETDWSWPIQISDAASLDEIPIGGHLYVDQHGIIHLVWRQGALPDGGPPRRIAHVKSTDFGETWSVPRTIAEGLFASPSLTETPDGDLMLLYIGALGITGRYYRISTDGGDSWGESQTIAEGIAGLTGHSYAWDSAGTLHYVSASHLGGLNGIAYMQWREHGSWTTPMNVLPAATSNTRQAYEPVIHITEGNRLHIFYLGSDHSTIYYTTAQSTAPWQPSPQPVTPTVTTTLTVESTVPYISSSMIEEESQQVTANFHNQEIDRSLAQLETAQPQPMRPLWAGFVSAVLLSGLAVVFHIIRRDRKA